MKKLPVMFVINLIVVLKYVVGLTPGFIDSMGSMNIVVTL